MAGLYRKILAFFFLLSWSFPAFSAQPIDHSAWDQFLKRYVNEEGLVDYQGAKSSTELELYRKQLASIRDPLRKKPREELLALWLNAYNTAVILLILEHYPIKEINDVPGGWDLPILEVAGIKQSLNHILSSELIWNFRDEKIHLALSCGAQSCPRLKQEAFQGPTVEGQLFNATREFVNDSKYVRIVPENHKVEISQIFKWHAGDFKLDFGATENERKLTREEFAVLSFIAYYLEDVDKTTFLEEEEYKIRYIPFDWSLNEWKRENPNPSTSSKSP